VTYDQCANLVKEERERCAKLANKAIEKQFETKTSIEYIMGYRWAATDITNSIRALEEAPSSQSASVSPMAYPAGKTQGLSIPSLLTEQECQRRVKEAAILLVKEERERCAKIAHQGRVEAKAGSKAEALASSLCVRILHPS